MIDFDHKLIITLFLRNYLYKSYKYFSSMFREREIDISAEMMFLAYKLLFILNHFCHNESFLSLARKTAASFLTDEDYRRHNIR